MERKRLPAVVLLIAGRGNRSRSVVTRQEETRWRSQIAQRGTRAPACPLGGGGGCLKRRALRGC